MVLLVLATRNVPQPDAADFYGLAEEVMAEVTANTKPVDEEMKNMLAELAKEDVDAPTTISNNKVTTVSHLLSSCSCTVAHWPLTITFVMTRRVQY